MEVNCRFSLVSGLYQCIVNDAEIKEPGQVIKAFKGKHLSRKRNADVKQLIFNNEPKLEYIPRDLYKHFPKLVLLSITQSAIKEISKQDLQGLENLKSFWMSYCRLTSLPDDLLTNMPNLRFVLFDNNQIESASSNLLKPLVGRSGVSVYLRGNKNIDAWYNSEDIDRSTHKSLEELMKAIDEKCSKPITTNNIASEDFNEGIKKLWTSGCFSDFKIISRGKEFNVHRSVLAIRSSVMSKMFEDHKDATELKINNFSPITVESLLHFIYTNEIIHKDNAEKNFAIAQKFKIQKMKSAYEEIISNDLNQANAYEIFMFAHQHKAEGLKQKAFKMIGEQFPDILPPKLMEDPAKLKKLIDTRREYKKLLE